MTSGKLACISGTVGKTYAHYTQSLPTIMSWTGWCHKSWVDLQLFNEVNLLNNRKDSVEDVDKLALLNNAK